MRYFTIKRGSPLGISLTFANADGSAFALGGVTIAGELRDVRGVLVAELEVVPTSVPGMATITCVDTDGWPLGMLAGDLKIDDGVLPVITQSFGVNVKSAVTQTQPAQPGYNPVVDP